MQHPPETRPPNRVLSCWCGNRILEPFSSDYQRCAACETLVRIADPDVPPPAGDPARADLLELSIHFLRGLMRYCLPAARVLELGSGPGDFAALMRWAGFDATSLDMSSEIAVSRDITPGSVDAIVLIGVLEHLSDPNETLRDCLRLLKPGGLIFLHTAEYPEGKSIARMQMDDDPLLLVLTQDQPRYLFSKSSARLLLQEVGMEHVNFEPPISFHGMTLVASRVRPVVVLESEADTCLERKPGDGAVLPLRDLNRQSEETATLAAMCRDFRNKIAVQEQIIASHGRRFAKAEDLLRRLRQSHVFRFMRRLGLWAWLDEDEGKAKDWSKDDPGFSPRSTSEVLRRVVVDLTPVAAGGGHGGAKVMTLELIRQLGRFAPSCEFILLTSELSHDELAALDAPNVRRVCVTGSTPTLSASKSLVLRARSTLAKFLPAVGLTIAGAQREEPKAPPAGYAFVRQLEADLLFCPFTAPIFFHPSVPTVCVVYDLQHAYYPLFFDKAEIQERDRNLDKAIRSASIIVCISEYVRSTLLEKTNVAPDRLETIRIQMPGRLRTPSPVQRECVLKMLELVSGRFLLYPANFWPHKNHEVLLTAFGMFLADHPGSGLKLVLTGSSGARQDYLRDAVCHLGLSEAVVFPGYLAEEELSALLHSCLALIFPSLFEGFGMPLLESMAAGRPVLCSNTTSLPEVAGGAALLFDPRVPAEIADAIARISRDPDLRRELVAKGAQRVAAIGGPEEMAAGYLRTFRRAVQHPAGHRIESLGPSARPGLVSGLR